MIYQVPKEHFEVLIAFLAIVIINQFFLLFIGLKKNYFLKKQNDLLERVEKEREERLQNGHPVYRKAGKK